MPYFGEGDEVRFTLRGDDLLVRRERRRWHLRWQGRQTDAQHVDRAVAQLLQEPPSAVMPIVARLLRAEPGSALD
jgi:hypothetical protein